MEYTFEWDPRKATLNLRKHGVSFERAATVFLDARAVSIPDVEHSADEERWVTMGLDAAGRVLVVVHTFTEVDSRQCRIRLISGRTATKKEGRQYAKGTR